MRCLLVFAFLAFLSFAAGSVGDTRSSKRLINGDEVCTNNPSVVLFYNDGQVWCSGVMVGPRAAVSVAHCFTDVPVAGVTVMCGSQERNVTSILIHEDNINGDSYEGFLVNDIVLLQFDNAITETDDCQIALLPESPAVDYAYERAEVYSHTFDETQVVGTVGIYSGEYCSYYWWSGTYNHLVHLCMQDLYYNYFICYGDGGAGVFVGDVLVGLASWVDYYCDAEGYYPYPSVAVRVSSFVCWIRANMA